MLSQIRPHFSPEITLGHLLQATVMLLTIGGGIVTPRENVRAPA